MWGSIVANRTTLICDIDNTLFDWNAYYASAFRALVHVASRELGVVEDQLYAELKSIHQHFRSIEYTFSVQLLPSAAHLSEPEMKQLLDKCIGAFNSVKLRRLKAHDGVRSTLDWGNQQGISIIAVSNAPMHQAYRRIQRMGLRPFFTGLVAWEGWESKDRDDPLVGHRMPTSFDIDLPWSLRLRYEELKPNTVPYEKVLGRYSAEPDNVWVVGDSLFNDIFPATQLGLRTVWARYGSAITEKNLTTLLRVTDWTDAQVRAIKSAPTVVPQYAIDAFSELLDILPIAQPTLFEVGR